MSESEPPLTTEEKWNVARILARYALVIVGASLLAGQQLSDAALIPYDFECFDDAHRGATFRVGLGALVISFFL